MRWAPFAISLVAAALLFVAPACHTSADPPAAERTRDVSSIDGALEPLRSAFEKDASRVRLLLLASPTCGECLRGVATVNEQVLQRIAAPDLIAYVVWVPMLPGDGVIAARAAAARFGDPRIRHYWDPDHALGRALGDRLAIPKSRPSEDHGLAWDVYLLYARGDVWPAGAPPTPAFWMHQLDRMDVAIAPKLDGAVLRARVVQALAPN